MKTAVISYQIPDDVKQFISQGAEKKHLSRGRFLSFLIEDHQRLEKENSHLKAYFEMASDKEFLQSQIEESEEDLKAELAVNKELLHE